MYLVDTNVISEHRRAKSGRGNPNVIAWIASVPPTLLFVSVLTLRELETWVLLTAWRDAEQGRHMRIWFETQVERAFAGRVLLVDQSVASHCAPMFVPHPRPYYDSLIAATALVHGLTIVTRNISDFAPMGVKLLNPWEPQ